MAMIWPLRFGVLHSAARFKQLSDAVFPFRNVLSFKKRLRWWNTRSAASATSVLLMLSVQLFMLKRLYSQSLDCLPRIYAKHMLAIKTINIGQKTLWTGEKRQFVEGSVKSKDFRSILWNSSETKSNLCGNVGIGKGAHQHKSEKAV